MIEELQSGDALQFREQKFGEKTKLVFWADINGKTQRVACSSDDYYERFCAQKKKGYLPVEARVQFVVSWWDQNAQEECYIVLPILRLRKKK